MTTKRKLEQAVDAALDHFRWHRFTKAAEGDPLKGPGFPESISLIGALRAYVAGRGPGSQSADEIDREAIELYRRIIDELKGSDELPASWSPFDPKAFEVQTFGGYNQSGFHKALPLGVVAKNDDHRQALIALMEVGRDLLNKAYGRGNDSGPLPSPVEQVLASDRSRLRKSNDGSLSANLEQHGWKAAR